jgi:hypothetical protein
MLKTLLGCWKGVAGTYSGMMLPMNPSRRWWGKKFFPMFPVIEFFFAAGVDEAKASYATF